MRIWVVLLILVAGSCTKSMADDEEDRCHNDQQCMHHGCDRDETPYCSQFSCHCRDKPYCQRHSDCSSCSGHAVGYCNHYHHYCTCSGSVHCSHDSGCDQYICASNMYPTCTTVHGHYRCVCAQQPVKHPATTQTAVKPYCQQHSDCSSCSGQQIAYCSHSDHVCACSESIFCKNENGCDHFTCASNMYPTCRIVHGHHRCICAPSTQTAGTQITNCKQQSDCANYVCSNDRPIPYCRHDVVLIFDLGRHCHCTGCLEDKDCTCPAGTTSHCDHYYSHGPGSCHCTPIITSTSTDGTTTPAPISTDAITTTAGTTTPAPTTRRTTTRAPTASVVSTTTSVPPSVSPLSISGCHDHTDCSGHLCPPDKQPYCKIDRYSSTCHCTDCTEHKHCFCPQGLVGQCHFDYIQNSHSCVCGLIPDTTTIVPTTTTKSTSVLTMSTTTSTSVPTMSTTTKSASVPTVSTTKKSTPMPTTTTQSSSTQPTTITSTLPSRSTPKSTTRVASTASSTVDSSTNTPTSTTPTAFSSTKSGIRQCHTCGDANNSISCDTRTIYLGNLQSCAPGEDFCMTDIVHDGNAYPKTYKRCVTEQECRNKWLHQSSDLEYCINYGSVPMSGQYSCHFCCVTDGCNAGQVPDKSTYYTKA